VRLGQSYFESFSAEAFDVTSLYGQAEDDWLDFKESATPNGELTNDDKNNLAEALSGFANSDGGVILWGVSCKQRGKEDVADAAPGIPNAETFMRRMITASSTLTDPPVLGIQHRVLQNSTKEARKLVATYVPAADSGLHRAKREKMHSFFYRAGDNFLVMPTYLVAEKFARRTPARLAARVRARRTGSSGTAYSYRLSIEIVNESNACAFKPAVKVEVSRIISESSWEESVPNPFKRRHRWNDGQQTCFVTAPTETVYPHEYAEATALRFPWTFHPVTPFQDLVLTIDLMQDGPTFRSEIIFTEADFRGLESKQVEELMLQPTAD
jgi:hypothetical protein